MEKTGRRGERTSFAGMTSVIFERTIFTFKFSVEIYQL